MFRFLLKYITVPIMICLATTLSKDVFDLLYILNILFPLLTTGNVLEVITALRLKAYLFEIHQKLF